MEMTALEFIGKRFTIQAVTDILNNAKDDTWHFYRENDGKGDYRWKRVPDNSSFDGNAVGASSEGYRNMNDCISNAIRNGFDTMSKMELH